MSFIRDLGNSILDRTTRKTQTTTGDDEQDQYTVTSQIASQHGQGPSGSLEVDLNFYPPNDSQHLTQETEEGQRSSHDNPQGHRARYAPSAGFTFR